VQSHVNRAGIAFSLMHPVCGCLWLPVVVAACGAPCSVVAALLHNVKQNHEEAASMYNQALQVDRHDVVTLYTMTPIP